MMQTSQQYANAVIGNDDKILQDIHIKSKNIAVYQRNIDFLNKELNEISKQSIECRASGTAQEILSILKDFFNTNFPDCSFLFNDITELLRLFERTTKASSFRLLLTTVSTNMCRKFHSDINDLRLLCTYMGPGTLWLPDEHVDYKALQAGKDNQEIVKDEQQIQQASAGDVVLLKGALYPDANPILHRSPSIEEHGEKRLLLRIDTNEFLNIWKNTTDG